MSEPRSHLGPARQSRGHCWAGWTQQAAPLPLPKSVTALQGPQNSGNTTPAGVQMSSPPAEPFPMKASLSGEGTAFVSVSPFAG